MLPLLIFPKRFKAGISQFTTFAYIRDLLDSGASGFVRIEKRQPGRLGGFAAAVQISRYVTFTYPFFHTRLRFACQLDQRNCSGTALLTVPVEPYLFRGGQRESLPLRHQQKREPVQNCRRTNRRTARHVSSALIIPANTPQ